MATINLNPSNDYSQPVLANTSSGWKINSLDYQIVTKSDGWNQGQSARLAEYEAGKTLLGINYCSLAVPYDNTTKYANYVADARTKGLKIWHRSHWNAWQGDNSVGSVTSITRSGSTATVTTSTNHLLATGNTVVIADATQTDYNGEYTVTVTGANTFTYTVANSPTTPATGTILWRFGKQTYLDKTYDFIVENPSLFQAGDLFGMCVEADQADGGSKNWTFRDNGKSTGSFSHTLYNQFQKDQVRYANAGFTAIGLGGLVSTNMISHHLSNMNLNGGILDSGNGGNSNGLGNSDIVNYFNGVLCFDHYMSDSYRYTDATKYWTRYSSDLEVIHTAFPNCLLMVGEWGYHTTDTISESERAAMYMEVMNVMRTKDYIIGVNLWNHMGQSSSSIFTDNSGTLVTEGRTAARFIKNAFTGGNKAFGWRIRV